jgi:hypothetical protein
MPAPTIGTRRGMPLVSCQRCRINLIPSTEIEVCIEDPMVSPTEMYQVVWIVMPGIVVKMRYCQTGFDFKTADNATHKWIMRVRDATSLSGVAR